VEAVFDDPAMIGSPPGLVAPPASRPEQGRIA